MLKLEYEPVVYDESLYEMTEEKKATEDYFAQSFC